MANITVILFAIIAIFLSSLSPKDEQIDNRPKTYELTKGFLLSDCDRRRNLTLQTITDEVKKYISREHLLDSCNCIHRSIIDATNDVASDQSDLHQDYIRLAYLLYFNTPKPEELDARLSKALDEFFKQRIIKNKPKLIDAGKFIDKLNAGYASCKAKTDLSNELMERYYDQYHSRKR